MRHTFVLLTVLLLAACQDAPVTPPPAPLEFSGPAFTLNVESVTIAQDYKSSKHLPNVELLSDLPPAEAIKRWVGTKLVAAGHGNTLEVDIKDASIIRTDLPRQKSGIEGAFTTEQTEQYDGLLEVAIKIYSPTNALPVAQAYAKAHVLHTLPDNAAPIDRERTYHQISVELMKALEPELDENVRAHFGRYLM